MRFNTSPPAVKPRKATASHSQQKSHTSPPYRPPRIVTRVKGITYYVDMNLTLSLDDKVVKEARKIAIERDTTLTALIRDFLEELVSQDRFSGRKRRER